MISEQTVIDILYFLLRNVFHSTFYFIMLTVLLTPKYNKALIILPCSAVSIIVQGLSEKLFSISMLYHVCFVAVLLLPALLFFKEKKRVCFMAAVIRFAYLTLLDMSMSAYSIAVYGFYPTKIYPVVWQSVEFLVMFDIIHVVTFIPVAVIWNRLTKKINPKSMSFFMLFPLGQAIFITSCTYPTWVTGSEFRVFDNPFMLLAVIISLISDVLMFVALRDNDNLQKTRGRVAEMEKQMELQLQYYDNLADKFTEIREYRHDINNLVSVAEALINDTSSESSKAFIGEMKEKALNMKVPMFCENSIVNAVLWKKQNEVLENDLEFTAEVDRTEQFPLDRIDVCSLLANLLDNAIREAAELGGFVKVLIGRNHGLLIIDVSNSTLREYSGTEKRPKTGKTGDHGHGMEIAEKIARKYDGKFVFKAREGVAHSIVSLMTKTD